MQDGADEKTIREHVTETGAVRIVSRTSGDRARNIWCFTARILLFASPVELHYSTVIRSATPILLVATNDVTGRCPGKRSRWHAIALPALGEVMAQALEADCRSPHYSIVARDREEICFRMDNGSVTQQPEPKLFGIESGGRLMKLAQSSTCVNPVGRIIME